MGGADVNRPRAADDFAAIRARMEELRREREGGRTQRQGGTAGLVHAARWEHALAAIRGQLGAGKGPPIWITAHLGRERDC
jgi:hypothetical protein